jgi:ubiquinone/menaquinone biosynthesis C-methylase UbiE
MPANYDNSAPFYDRLSRLVFGKALVNAQVWLLPHIPKNTTILIIGGGTGWILNEITKLHPSGLYITYVEISANMMALSRKRNIGANKVEFINQAVEDAGLPQKFDVVITPFLLDNFTEDGLNVVFHHIHETLLTGGLWLNADFQLMGKWWQFLLLKSMLLFFKVLCGVPSWHLPKVRQQFDKYEYAMVDQKSFFGDFVMSKVYRKEI